MGTIAAVEGVDGSSWSVNKSGGCDERHGRIHSPETQAMQRFNRGGQIDGDKAEDDDLSDQGSGTRDKKVDGWKVPLSASGLP